MRENNRWAYLHHLTDKVQCCELYITQVINFWKRVHRNVFVLLCGDDKTRDLLILLTKLLSRVFMLPLNYLHYLYLSGETMCNPKVIQSG